MVALATELNLNPPNLADELYLACPNCNSPHGMHHDAVTVYSRPKEDAKETFVTKVDGIVSTVTIAPSDGKNPSDRRDGIAIDLWCEACGTTGMQLTIEQHKGVTIIKTRIDGTQ